MEPFDLELHFTIGLIILSVCIGVVGYLIVKTVLRKDKPLRGNT